VNECKTLQLGFGDMFWRRRYNATWVGERCRRKFGVGRCRLTVSNPRVESAYGFSA